MRNLYTDISTLSRQHHLTLARWILRDCRLGRKEWQYIMGVSRSGMNKRLKPMKEEA